VAFVAHDAYHLQPVPLVYLDTSALKRPFDAPDFAGDRIQREQQAVRDLVRAVIAGRASLLSSFWLVQENEADRNRARAAAARILRRAWASVIETDELNRHTDRLVSLGLPAPDALHVAAAQIGGADYLVTTDDRLCRRLWRPAVAMLLTAAVLDPVALTESLEI